MTPASQSAQGNTDSAEETAPPLVQGASIIVDVTSAVVVGSWLEGTAFRPTIGSGYLHDDDQGKGQKSITFTVKVETPARYAIRLHYNSHETRSSCTPVTVKIGEEAQAFSVNQRKSDGRGFVLGTFDVQDEVEVVISNAGTDGFVIVDGLELIRE